MERDLAGKTALVTGGSRGLGQGISERLAAAGALVAVNYAGNREAADATVARIEAAGGQAFAVQARLGGQAGAEQLALAIDKEFTKRTGGNGLDILINNIGGGEKGTIFDCTQEFYDRMMGKNLRAPFFP